MMFKRTNTALAAIATAGSLLAYSALLTPAVAQTAASEHVQLAASYSPVVRNLQNLLNQSGYNAGPIDGLMGSRTRSAIEAYQRDNGLLITGQPSQGLLEHLQTTAAMQQPAAAAQPAAVQPPAQESATPATQLVIDVQSALRRRGYEVSVIDGAMDAETRSAIRAFQRDACLTITGEPTQDLLAKLRLQDSQPQQESSSNISKVQLALAARGYNAGPADGVMGPSTRNAIRTYQVDAGDEATGRIDSQLLTRLNIAPAASGQVDQGRDQQGASCSYATVFSDAFADGNYTANPSWTVYRGRFWVDSARALRSNVDTTDPQTSSNPQRTGNPVQDMLFAVLEEAFQQDQQSSGRASDNLATATIGAAAQIDNAYRLKIRIGVHRGDGRFVFGPYQSNLNSGYLLAYSSYQGVSVLRLLSVASGTTQVVAEATDIASLNDGGVHEITWLRREDGRMEVSIDGDRVLEETSNVYRNSFAGFTFTNFDGDFALHRVVIEDRHSQLGG